jgi:hypothetical protein
MPNVLNLFRAPKRRLPMEELTEALVVAASASKAARMRARAVSATSCL